MQELFTQFLQHFWTFLLVVILVVFVHELGHYLAAKWRGVHVKVFSIGFGPELFAFHDKSGTRWRFAIILLGGYVAMQGEEEDLEQIRKEKQKAGKAKGKKLDGHFYRKRLSDRALIVAAGPVANFLLGVILISGFFMKVGVSPDTNQIEIESISPESPAEIAGLQAGDIILKAGRENLNNFRDLQRIVAESNGAAINLSGYRDGSDISFNVTPSRVIRESGPGWFIGVRTIIPEPVAVSPPRAIMLAGAESWNIAALTLRELFKLVIGKGDIDNLGGPIRIAEISRDFAIGGIASFSFFIALISINLGIINLLPLPALDGGHLAFYAIEAVRGKPLSAKIRTRLIQYSLLFLIALMVLVTCNDISNIS